MIELKKWLKETYKLLNYQEWIYYNNTNFKQNIWKDLE